MSPRRFTVRPDRPIKVAGPTDPWPYRVRMAVTAASTSSQPWTAPSPDPGASGEPGPIGPAARTDGRPASPTATAPPSGRCPGGVGERQLVDVGPAPDQSRHRDPEEPDTG